MTLAFALHGCQSDPNAVFDDGYLSAVGASSSSGTTASGAAGVATDAPGRGGAGGNAATAGNEAGGTASESGAATGGTDALAGSATGGSTPLGGSATGGSTPLAGSATGGSTPLGGSANGGTDALAGSAAGGSTSQGGTAMGGAATDGGTATTGGGGAVGGTTTAGGSGTVTYGEPVTMESQNIGNTFVISCSPLASYATDPTLVVDNEPCQSHILIKPSVAEIPADALIKNAKVTLTCTNSGPALAVLRPETDWAADTVTWSTRPTATVTLGSIGAIPEGTFVIDVTSLVQAWVDGTRKPYGLALRTAQSDGLIFASSRAVDPRQRPKFSVTYAVPLK